MTTSNTISRHDFAIGTVIALVMAAVFAWLSPGRALLVTFVPGVAASWAVFALLFARRQPLPEFGRFVPWYLLTLAVQFLHFAEEFVTSFQDRFGVIYGGGQIDNATFVIVNMTSYFVFLVSTAPSPTLSATASGASRQAAIFPASSPPRSTGYSAPSPS